MENHARPQKVPVAFDLIVDYGFYYEQVRRYLDTFRRDNVRIYLHEDTVADTAMLVKDVCACLGVPFYDGRFLAGIPRRVQDLAGVVWVLLRN